MKTKKYFYGSLSSVALLPLIVWTSPVATLPLGEAQLARSRAFDEPLVPIGGHRTARENRALGRALAAYEARADSDDTSAITGFLQANASSVWRASLLTNLGSAYRRTGRFSNALEAWNETWKLAKNEEDLQARAVGDRALGELSDLTARLGHQEALEKLLEEVGDRDVRGPGSERLLAAREALWQMRREPEDSFRCGPCALSKVSEANWPNHPRSTEILNARATPRGTSLHQLGALADKFQMSPRAAKRQPGAAVPVPSVMHWKQGHSAIRTSVRNGLSTGSPR